MTTPDPQPEQTDDGDESQPITLAEAKKLRREAASLRVRLHDAEGLACRVNELEEQLGAAAARETARDRAEAERIASEHLIDASDLWNQQPDVQAFYDEEFAQLVPDKVREAVAAIVAAKPHLARPQNTPPPSQRPVEGLRGSFPTPEQKPASWASALRGR